MFWQFPSQFTQNTAVITETENLDYGQLHKRCQNFMGRLPAAGNLVLLRCKNDLQTLIAWLACLNKKVPVLLVDSAAPKENLQELLLRFAPVAIVAEGEVVFVERANLSHEIDPRLSAMISTSGSTGSSKQVALSYDNLQANAESICGYLPVQSDDTTITTLPFHYSYGLSVINTHLLSGATIVISEKSIMSREFWDLIVKHQINSFAGVPYTFEMLRRLGFFQKELPALRYVTQAGGRLANNLILEFAEHLQQQHKAFYVMYGQTEATARMAWLDPAKLPQKVGSIGNAIPGGKLSLVDANKQPVIEDGVPGELVYCGSNVMLGYATCTADLACFTPLTQLHTGDLALRDRDGDFFIVGRVKRFVKIFGTRINLDEVEALLEQNGYYVKVTGTDKHLYLAISQQNMEQKAIQFLSKKIKLHPSAIRCRYFPSYPLKANQKTDYASLLSDFEGCLSDE